MYPIDFLTATPREVIQRSITCHPSLYRDAMLEAVASHSSYAAISHDKTAAEIAARLGKECRFVAECIESENTDAIIRGGMDSWISALSIAFRLQCVPHSLRADIVARQPV